MLVNIWKNFKDEIKCNSKPIYFIYENYQYVDVHFEPGFKVNVDSSEPKDKTWTCGKHKGDLRRCIEVDKNQVEYCNGYVYIRRKNNEPDVNR